MTDITDNAQINEYVEVISLSQKEKTSVSIVMNSDKNQLAIKKTMVGKSSMIYHKIMDIDHLHLPKIYLIHEEEEKTTVIEEYIEGKTLQDMLTTALETMEEAKLLDMILQLCKPLQFLHNLPTPIIHRDIKPTNIIVSNTGTLKLIDFDASREYKHNADKDTISLGTIEYAAPEQFGYSQTDIRSDIYAIGMVIMKFLQKAEEDEVIYKHMAQLKKIVDKCTMFDPKQRFQTIEELQASVVLLTAGKSNYKVLRILSIISSAVLLITILCVNHINRMIYKEDGELKKQETRIDMIDKSDLNLVSQEENDGINQNSHISQVDISEDPMKNNGIKVDSVKNGDLETEDINIDGNVIEVVDDNNINNSLDSYNFDDNVSMDKITDISSGDSDSKGTIVHHSNKDNVIDSHTNSSEDTIDSTIGSDTAIHESDIDDSGNIEPKSDQESSDKSVEISHSHKEIRPMASTPYIEFYKNENYSEDMKIQIQYNSASSISNVSLNPYGRVNSSNYSIDGNIMTIQKEFLSKLPNNSYELTIFFDTVYAVTFQFRVLDESEKPQADRYLLSHYYQEFYIDNPDNLTYLINYIGSDKLIALWNGSSKIDGSYYRIEDSGKVVTLNQEYLQQFMDGTILRLRLEFKQDHIEETEIKIVKMALRQPSLDSAENTYKKSNPKDVKVKIQWNDANNISSIRTETPETPSLSSSEYQIKDDDFILRKEFLDKLAPGTYQWALLFDTGFDNRLKIHIRE